MKCQKCNPQTVGCIRLTQLFQIINYRGFSPYSRVKASLYIYERKIHTIMNANLSQVVQGYEILFQITSEKGDSVLL